MHLSLLLLALLLPLLLRLLLRTSTLIDGVEIDFTQHIHLGCHLSLALKRINGWFGSSLGRFLGLSSLNDGLWHWLRFHLSLGFYLWSWFRLGLWLHLSLWSRLWLHLSFGFCLRSWFGFGLRLWLGLYFCLRLWLHWFGRLLLLGCWLTKLTQVNLTKRRKCLTRLLLDLSSLRLYFLLWLFLFLLLRENHPSLSLYVLVTLELLDQRLILLVGDLRIDIGVVLDFTQALLSLQIVDSCLKANVQFC